MRMPTNSVCCLAIIFIINTVPTSCISMRKIYTFYSSPRTWNEAKAICTCKFGHLIKVLGQRELSEIQYLDTEEANVWKGQMTAALSSSGIWTGLHDPFIGESLPGRNWTFQDCQAESPDAPLTISGNANEFCAAYTSGFSLVSKDCSETRPFICQRYNGDCWFEPFAEEQSAPGLNPDVNPLVPNLSAAECAMKCRDAVHTPYLGECWGFYYTTTSAPCDLVYRNATDVSSTYVKQANRVSTSDDPDRIFYVRRCFEGETGTGSFSDIVNVASAPDSTCDTDTFPGEAAAGQVCFCATKEHPPIPPAISVADAAAQYERELSIDKGNTSSSLRALTSAEDNRPSAIGVGASLGAGLLAFVFGGLFLLDLPVLISTFKQALQSFCGEPPSNTGTESDC
ncbi:uncharacterized protein LOC127856880 [Dreissena polymorpha]|uniref:uncharacterized protein LOC127856880 n=1 Tax=Dreissena polymorpha TaxID=45954 RepID=UPI0022653B2E|nr:uncharacterized protein LOC127856880 [Dreissena polymorpha]